jgi:two-component system, chemotaxis family, protein-glutamate methylesterase/glutaminase
MARDIVVIGGSAGALQPLIQIVRGLPHTLPAALFVVIHTSADTPGMLPQLIANGSTMPTGYARDGESIEHGRVYIAPGDHHLLIGNGAVKLSRGPRENGFRPAVDPLFRTAADRYGPRVVGIVLSGGLDDGTLGLGHVKRCGGAAIVQSLDEAYVASMPLNAMRSVEVDHVVSAIDMVGLIVRMAHESPEEKRMVMATDRNEKPDRVERGLHALKQRTFPGPSSGFTCPDCGGTLWESSDGDLLRFTCHVGHSYSPETLLNAKAAVLEPALWTALRTLEENGAFLRRMAERARGQGLDNIAAGYAERAVEIERRADTVRTVLVDQSEPTREAAELTRQTDELLARAAVSETEAVLAAGDAVGKRKRRSRAR